MYIEYNFNVSPRASDRARELGLTSMRLAGNNDLPPPIPGDLFSTEETMPLVFVVTRRHLHLVDQDHLQMVVDLDLPT